MVKSLLVLIALTSTAYANTTLKIDSAASKVEWIAGKEIGSNHNGSVAVKSGEVKLKDNKLESGEIVIDMSKITVLDIPATDSSNKKLKDHLDSDDFFSVKKHPEAKLVIKKVEHTRSNLSNVTADLTIKGITKPVKFPVTLEVKDGVYTATGDIKVDRLQYDIKYNSKNFFNLPVDRIIKNDFDIKFVAVTQK